MNSKNEYEEVNQSPLFLHSKRAQDVQKTSLVYFEGSEITGKRLGSFRAITSLTLVNTNILLILWLRSTAKEATAAEGK